MAGHPHRCSGWPSAPVERGLRASEDRGLRAEKQPQATCVTAQVGFIPHAQGGRRKEEVNLCNCTGCQSRASISTSAGQAV
jgi:hypothetical protein